MRSLSAAAAAVLVAGFASTALANSSLLSGAQVLELDGKRVPLTQRLQGVSVVLLWTSMCSDPVGQLQSFDALAGAFAKDRRLSVFAVSVDQAKNEADLEVIREVAAPAKASYPIVSDTGFSVLSFVDGKDHGGKVPNELRVPQVLIIRDGEIRHRGGLPGDGAVAHYKPLIEAELKALKRAPPAAKR